MRVLFEPEVWGIKMFSNQDLRKMIFSAVCGTVFADAGGTDRYADCKLCRGGAVVISQYIDAAGSQRAAGTCGKPAVYVFDSVWGCLQLGSYWHCRRNGD